MLAKELMYMEWYALRLLLACVCGAIVGFERTRRHKDAGIRTHVLVSLGAALFTIVSEYGFGNNADTARVASNVVTGIGFLGAGVIFLRGRSITGLTTAAGIWTMAGIGMTLGSGMYALGILATLLVIVMQHLMHWLLPSHEQMHWQLSLLLRSEASTQELRDSLQQIPGMDVQSFQVSRREDDALLVQLTCVSTNPLGTEQAVKLLRDCPSILEIKG